MTTVPHALRMPAGLSLDGRRAWKVLSDRLLAFGAFQVDADRIFYSPTEWMARGEKHAQGAVLVVTYDGGAHRRFLTLDEHDYPAAEAMQAALSDAGFFFEEGAGWYGGVCLSSTAHPALPDGSDPRDRVRLSDCDESHECTLAEFARAYDATALSDVCALRVGQSFVMGGAADTVTRVTRVSRLHDPPPRLRVSLFGFRNDSPVTFAYLSPATDGWVRPTGQRFSDADQQRLDETARTGGVGTLYLTDGSYRHVRVTAERKESKP